MTPRIANITIFAEDPAALARFWGAVMGYPEWTSWPDDELAELRGAGMTDDELLDRAEVEAECERIVALGATVEQVLDGLWGPYEEFAIMMRDPEGNEFCLQ